MISGFGSKIQGRKPKGKVITTRNTGRIEQNALHDILGMPIHHRVLEVESLQVCYSSGLHFLREAEMATQLRNFGDIKLNEKVLLVGVEKKHV